MERKFYTIMWVLWFICVIINLVEKNIEMIRFFVLVGVILDFEEKRSEINERIKILEESSKIQAGILEKIVKGK